jgi:hypothetical protein
MFEFRLLYGVCVLWPFTSSLFDEAYVALEVGSEALWWYGTNIGSDLYGLL